MENKKEIRRIFNALEEIAKLAEHASLTGALDKGTQRCVQQYNALLDQLEDLGAIAKGLFPPLSEKATMDEVGVASKQLAAYLQEDVKEEAGPTKQVHGGGNIILNIGGKGIGTADLGEIGKFIREHLPNWLKGEEKEEKKEEASTSKESKEVLLNKLEGRIAELGERLQTLAEQMEKGSLDPATMKKLGNEMKKLGKQQIELIHQHALIREQSSAWE